jgi:hypothetical protein
MDLVELLLICILRALLLEDMIFAPNLLALRGRNREDTRRRKGLHTLCGFLVRPARFWS